MIMFTVPTVATKPSSTTDTLTIYMTGTYTTPTMVTSMSTRSLFQRPTQTHVHPRIVASVTMPTTSMDRIVATKLFHTAITSTTWSMVICTMCTVIIVMIMAL